jgi:hypothetical protein
MAGRRVIHPMQAEDAEVRATTGGKSNKISRKVLLVSCLLGGQLGFDWLRFGVDIVSKKSSATIFLRYLRGN